MRREAHRRDRPRAPPRAQTSHQKHPSSHAPPPRPVRGDSRVGSGVINRFIFPRTRSRIAPGRGARRANRTARKHDDSMRENGETKIRDACLAVCASFERTSAAVERRGIPSRREICARSPRDARVQRKGSRLVDCVDEWVHTRSRGVHTPRRAVVARARRRHRRARERCAGANRRAYDRQRIERACPREGVART